MATKEKEPETNPFIKGAREMLSTPLNAEVSKSFMLYSMSVVYSRALADALDGLKPVQRRILYSMYKDGFVPSGNYVKSQRTIGNAMAQYHPHGDSSIYDAMVRLAQPWVNNLPELLGYGNWGDAGGSGAASSRYTECKLSPEGMLLLEELRENTVDMRPNYDGEQEEPVVLPVQFPVLLINGTVGIAVGFASNMAPHNPGEVMDAARWLLTHPNASLDKLMEFVPGPDFPTGGQVLGMDQVQQAYETGQGKIRLRGKVTITPTGRGKHELVFSELPYQTKTETLLESIKKLQREGKLAGLADAADLADRNYATRFVIETKAGFNPEVVLADLYANTPLEVTFGINNTTLVNGMPRVLGLKEQLQLFIDHRLDVVTRRSQNRRDKRANRLHLVEGLLKALANIDEVIRIVRTSADASTAQVSLIKKFKIDEVQADYILSLQLRRLTRFDQIELNEEKLQLEKEIAELDDILNNESVKRELIGKELEAVKKKIDRPRRTVLVGGALAEHLEATKEIVNSASAEVEDGDSNAVVYVDGTIRRVDGKQAIKAAKVGGKTIPVLASIPTTIRGRVVFITNKGRGYRVEMLHVGDKPIKAASMLTLGRDERVIAVAPGAGENLGAGIFFATRNGTVKITNPDYPLRSDDFDLISIEAGDELISARWVEKIEGGDLVFVSSDASLLRVDAAKVRPQGRTGAGVAGISLGVGQRVLAAAFVPEGEKESAQVVNYTGQSMKVSPLSLYPYKGRATGGTRSIAFLKGETEVQFAHVGVNPALVGADGKPVALPPVSQKRDGSGVKTIETPVSGGY